MNNKNQKCRSFEKGTSENTNAVPLEKEQQKSKVLLLWKRNSRKHKCCSFGKGTTKIKSVVPLEKEQ